MADLNTGLKFIIVGASVSGLAAAIALKSAGHTVLVLEKDSELGGVGSVPNGSGCAQIPPNGCKILLDLGLEALIAAHSAPVSGFSVYKYAEEQSPSPEYLGINRWDPEMLSEARGGYMQFSHRDLIRILYDLAINPASPPGLTDEGRSAHVTILLEAEVVSVDCDAPSVTLRTGDIHTGDAVIGADGATGVVRRILMDEEGVSPEDDIPTGLAAYSAIVANDLLPVHDLTIFGDYPGCTLWLGSNRGVRTFPVGPQKDISLLIYTPDNSQDGTWTKEAEKEITDVLGSCHEDIRKMAALAGPATCVQIKKPYALESWVSESGRVAVLGDAAHPFPPGSVHPYAVALEDGVFIGKIFSHTRNGDRVPEFLRAFQEHREPRCSRIHQMEKDYIEIITLPDGESQVERDTSFRAKHAAGQNVLDGDLQEMMEDFRVVFGYEAMDDADEWYMTWGRYHDSTQSDTSPQPHDGFFNTPFSTFTSTVVAGRSDGSGMEDEDAVLATKFKDQVKLNA